jgi:nucleotide-binding universal stress UspA family protein
VRPTVYYLDLDLDLLRLDPGQVGTHDQMAVLARDVDRRRPARSRPSSALLELSAHVDLIVIGSRRRGPVARLVLGSTGEAVVHDARCPILVAPRTDD